MIQSAFGDVEPEVMASMCNKLKQEIDNLNQELASRPHQNDLDTKQKEVDLLSQDLIELRQKFNETEYLELKKSYTPEQIQEVFIDMENDIGLNKRRRNCFQTAFSWLKKRFGNPQSDSKKTGGAVFCGLDENGSPIFKQEQ